MHEYFTWANAETGLPSHPLPFFIEKFKLLIHFILAAINFDACAGACRAYGSCECN